MFTNSSGERKQLTPAASSSVDQYYCKLCDVQCTGRESYDNHTSGLRHCKKFLTKQNDLGFDEFEQQFSDVPFNKRCGNVPPPAPREQYALQVYRSGLANKFSCKACGANTFQMLKWFEHVYSYDHGQKIQSLQNSMSRALFLNQFGDLPGPNPKIFAQKDGKNLQRYEDDKMHVDLTNGTEDEYPFNLNLDSLIKPQSSVESSFRSDDNRRSWSSAMPSNGVSQPHESHSPSDDVINQSRNRRHHHQHQQHQQQQQQQQQRHGAVDDDEYDDRRRTKAVRINESLSRYHPYSPPQLNHHLPPIEGRQSNHHHSRQNDYSSHSHNERTKSSSSRMDTAPPPRRLDGDQDMRFRSSSSDRVRRHSAEDRRHHATPTHTVNNNNFSFSLQTLLNDGDNSSDDILRQTLREFLADVIKRQPPRSDSSPKDDKLFHSLSSSDQRHLLNVHALTDDVSVWRCYGAINFLQALDPQLLNAISRLVPVDTHQQTSTSPSRPSHTARTARQVHH